MRVGLSGEKNLDSINRLRYLNNAHLSPIESKPEPTVEKRQQTKLKKETQLQKRGQSIPCLRFTSLHVAIYTHQIKRMDYPAHNGDWTTM